jgi:ElaB/YqjD/DUF883 family membrane-anchored ribosome-binding protein
MFWKWYKENSIMRSHNAFNFDPIAYVHVLREAGCDQKLAEAHAQQQSEVITMLIDEQLITKSDIKELETVTKLETAEIKHAITDLKHEMEGRTDKLEYKLKSVEDKSHHQHKELRNSIKMLDDKMHTHFKTLNGSIRNEIKNAIKQEKQGLLIKLAAINTGVLSALMVLFEFMQKSHVL